MRGWNTFYGLVNPMNGAAPPVGFSGWMVPALPGVLHTSTHHGPANVPQAEAASAELGSLRRGALLDSALAFCRRGVAGLGFCFGSHPK